ncbi:hypothetical protein GJU39_20950 [Pedobacter petrophilus]|uniref:Uncharacterized protein n=1 Tax=Pedobacter petrophilus TaxID=1908241 RepID=A0A7K0G4B6_9SPHI|nr:hypothetical protein [Pedobacter petrophilus]MRX78551.1 hypothetical protein [Pedobacter petrophilus]
MNFIKILFSRRFIIELLRILAVGAVSLLFYLQFIPIPVLLLIMAFGLYGLTKSAVTVLFKERKVGTELFVNVAVSISVIGKEYLAGAVVLMIILIAESETKFKKDYFTYLKAYYTRKSGGNTFHWYDLNAVAVLKTDDERTWREILEEIIAAIAAGKDQHQLKLSVNGIVSAAHGTVKRIANYTLDSIIVGITNRLAREDYDRFVAHVDFKLFVQKRAYDFFHNINNKTKK